MTNYNFTTKLSRFITLIFVLQFFFLKDTLAQKTLFQNQKKATIATPKDQQQSNFYTVNPAVQLSTKALINDFKTNFRLQKEDSLQCYRSDTDELGFTHHRYQQYYKGIKVEGAEILLHEKNQRVKTFNGKLLQQLNLNVNPQIDSKTALQIALEYTSADAYMWQDPIAEAQLKVVRQDPNATFYPSPELVIMDKKFSGNPATYQLYWKMTVYAQSPHSRQIIYIDAQNASIYHTINALQSCGHTTHKNCSQIQSNIENTGGVAITKYAGKQNIVTDSIGTEAYRLVEDRRGNGIETLNMEKSTRYGNAVDFLDDDNIWNNINDDEDEAATDAHWGTEMVYDFLNQKFKYKSFDNRDSKMLSYVHYDDRYFNAFWNGSWATYGDGDNSSTPLTAIDIVAHEVMHGVTQFTANLIYQDESGALNESFSDILGVSVEQWAVPYLANWEIGEQITTSPFRSMSDPNSQGNPDTYFGDDWFFGSGDNGGVHFNSGVQNHWFYLLTKGKQGVNDNKDTFQVKSIGMEKATAIAFRNLRYYLTENSNYFDARLGAIQAAEDLFGVCSREQKEVANAWFAVGVGNAVADNDLRMISIDYPFSDCGLTDSEQIAVTFRYNGCENPINEGEKIPVAFQVDSGTVVIDTFLATKSLRGGDSVQFTFPTPADFSTLGEHTIEAWTAFGKDDETYNDQQHILVENRFQQNIDIGVVSVKNPISQCYLSDAEPMSVEFGFFGCDSLEAGTEIVVGYERLGLPIDFRDTIVLDSTIYEAETFIYDFKDLLNVSYSGSYVFNIFSKFAIDTMRRNDTIAFYTVKTPFNLKHSSQVTFEGGVFAFDSLVLSTNKYSNAFISEAAKNTGNAGFLMTGGDLQAAFENNDIIIPDGITNWLVNEDFSAKMCFCVDATEMSEVNFSFDLKQTYSEVYSEFFGQDSPDASSCRVIVGDKQVSDTYTPLTLTEDTFVRHTIDLTAYVGTTFELCIETRNLVDAESDPFGEGDAAFIDNVEINAYPVGIEEVEVVSELENKEKISLQIYPNPNKGNFNLVYFNPLSQNKTNTFTIDIVDILGKKINTFSRNKSQNQVENWSFDLSYLNSGVYFVNVKDGNTIQSKRLLIY